MGIFSGIMKGIGVISSIAGGPIGPLVGAGLNYLGQRSANKTAVNLANTSIQRQVADLKAAGLNPMLALRLGGNATPPIANEMQGAVGALQAGYSANAMQRAQIENVRAQTEQTNAQTDKTNQETALLEAQVPFSAENAFNSKRILERQARMWEDQVVKVMEEARGARMTNDQALRMQPLMVEYQKLLNQAEALGMSRKEVQSLLFEAVNPQNWMDFVSRAFDRLKEHRRKYPGGGN